MSTTMKSRLRLYLNTDVILSLLENEPDKGENVARLLYQAADGKYQLLVSEHTAYELLRLGVSTEYVNQALRPFLLLNGSDVLVANSDILRSAMKTMRQFDMPFMKALHVVFAQRNNSLVVTRDLNFINAARSIVGVMTPEELL
jgi:predicted nucleic acid-binding protein